MRDDLEDAAAAIGAALAGGPPYAPRPLLHGPAPEGTALVVRTSGSTGTPREVALPATALRASAAATHERLGGPGHWFLALPATHVAGLQVIARTVVAGTRVGGGADGPFTSAGFAATAGAFLARGGRAYVSLVPTQAHRLVEAADAGARAGLDTLARFDAVLLGGAATPEPLRARLRDAGVRAVATYGMSETCGGCVYDGVPLPGVRVRLAGDARPGEADGVVELSGPTLATGYVGGEDAADATRNAFRADPDGTRWFRTSDLGTLDAHGRLTVLGRADDVIVSGGVKVAPAAVEAALAELGEACVVGVPDPEWGRSVTAVLTHPAVPAPGPPSAAPPPPPRLVPAPAEVTDRVRVLVAQRVGRTAVPRQVFVTDALPLRGPGKPDRAAVEAAVAEARSRTVP